ncbi:hypothetical protein ACOME3_007656 [Neoechinorhynchus agilis]
MKIEIILLVLHVMIAMAGVRLVDIDTLTFRIDQNTTSIKDRIMPQILCTGKRSSDCFALIDVVVCQNLDKSADSISSIKWKCLASLPNNIEFDRLTVSCESDPNDPSGESIIEGSCTLKYTVKEKSHDVMIWLLTFIFSCCILYAFIRMFCKKSINRVIATEDRTCDFRSMPYYYYDDFYSHYEETSETEIQSGTADTEIR